VHWLLCVPFFAGRTQCDKLQNVGRAKHCSRSLNHGNKWTAVTLIYMVAKGTIGIVVTLATKVNKVTSGKASKLHNNTNGDSNIKHEKTR